MNAVERELEKEKAGLSLARKRGGSQDSEEAVRPSILTHPTKRSPRGPLRTLFSLIVAGLLGWGAYSLFVNWDDVSEKTSVAWQAFRADVVVENEKPVVGPDGESLPFLGVKLEKKPHIGIFERIGMRFSAAFAAINEKDAPEPANSAATSGSVEKGGAANYTNDFWPPLTVTGVIIRTDPKKNLANVEGRFVGIGDTVKGIEILDITRSGVVINAGGGPRPIPVAE